MNKELRSTEVRSLGELIDYVRGSVNPLAEPWFRGQANTAWTLVPGSLRPEYAQHSSVTNWETESSRQFRRRAPALLGDAPQPNAHLEWLLLMQHYGLPTRLLDWTESLVVAAYFATLPPSKGDSPPREDDVDGRIFILHPGELNAGAQGSASPDTFEIPELPYPVLDILAGEVFKTPVPGEPFIAGLPDFQLRTGCLPFRHPSEDRRIRAQKGVFTFHTDADPLDRHKWANVFLSSIVIPASAKRRVQAELRLIGVNGASLFPDLENLAREIRDHKLMMDSGQGSGQQKL